MKKILVFLVALIGLGIGANAQECRPAGNVQPSISNGCGRTTAAKASFTNYNSYMVNVTAIINVVTKSGQTKTVTRTYVLAAAGDPQGNDTKSSECIDVAPRDDIDLTSCSVTISVSKCD